MDTLFLYVGDVQPALVPSVPFPGLSEYACLPMQGRVSFKLLAEIKRNWGNSATERVYLVFKAAREAARKVRYKASGAFDVPSPEGLEGSYMAVYAPRSLDDDTLCLTVTMLDER